MSKQLKKIDKMENKVLKKEKKIRRENLKNVQQKRFNVASNMGTVSDVITMSVAAPGSVPPQRWSSQFSQKKSAIATPFAILTPTFGQSSGSYPQALQAECPAFLFRRPERAAIIYDQNSASAPKQYVGQMLGGGGAPPNSTSTYVVDGYARRDIVVPNYNANLAYAPHGPVLYCGSVTDVNGRFAWCDLGDTLSVTVQSNTTGTLVVGCDYFGVNGFSQSFVEIAQAVVAGTPITVTLKNGSANLQGYYSLYLRTTAAAIQVVMLSTLQIAGSGSCFAHLSLPYFSSNIGSTLGTRITGASLMFSNTAAELNLGGTISAVQTGLADHWQDYLSTAGTLSSVSKQIDSKTMNMKDGMYGFLKPTCPDDFNYLEDIDLNANGVVVDSTYPLDKTGSFLVMVPNCPTPAGCSGYFTISFGIEYITPDPWREVAYATVNEREFAAALDRIRLLPQFHENPLHLGELWEGIKSVGRGLMDGVKEYGPLVLTAVKGLAKAM
jgi:hypothetical protein